MTVLSGLVGAVLLRDLLLRSALAVTFCVLVIAFGVLQAMIDLDDPQLQRTAPSRDDDSVGFS